MGEQTTDKKALNIKQFTIIFFLGLGYTIVYATPFIQYVFYDSLVEALQSATGLSHYDFWYR